MGGPFSHTRKTSTHTITSVSTTLPVYATPTITTTTFPPATNQNPEHKHHIQAFNPLEPREGWPSRRKLRGAFDLGQCEGSPEGLSERCGREADTRVPLGGTVIYRCYISDCEGSECLFSDVRATTKTVAAHVRVNCERCGRATLVKTRE